MHLEGPHSYKLAKEIVLKYNLRTIVYKNNKIKHALPKQFDGGKMQIALLERTPCYIDEKDKRRHVEFIRKPKRFFKRNSNYRLYEIEILGIMRTYVKS